MTGQRLLSLVESGVPVAAAARAVLHQAGYREAPGDPVFRERLAAAHEHRRQGPVRDLLTIGRRLEVDNPERWAVPKLDWSEH